MRGLPEGALRRRSIRHERTRDYILETRGLTKQFRGFYAVKNVSLRVRRHAMHALIGPNGAGKTTCFNLLTTFLPATRRHDPLQRARHHAQRPGRRRDRSGMVRSFQISAVFGQMSVLENVRVALQRQDRRHLRLLAQRRACCERLDDAGAWSCSAPVGLARWRRHAAAELSYGRKRALELATTIALEPELILLDEPMAGLGHEDIGPVMRADRRGGARAAPC